jgi:hypothetical protein
MPIIIDGTGTISGVSATGLTTAQTVASAQLPAGSVLQVVNATYSTLVSSASATFADTGLTVSITPKFATSKILILVDMNGCSAYTTTSSLGLQLLRGASIILTFETIAGSFPSIATNGSIGSSSTNYLDSPATTSSTTYKVQLARTSGSGTVYVNNYITGTASTITLMEIAA